MDWQAEQQEANQAVRKVRVTDDVGRICVRKVRVTNYVGRISVRKVRVTDYVGRINVQTAVYS